MRDGLDVVVVNYRTHRDLTRFLTSYDAHRPTVDTDIVVVNVAPRADDVGAAERWVRDHEGIAAHLQFEDNVGYARACNRAAALGNRRVVAFFNADVELTVGALDACYDGLLSDPRWGVLGPRQVDSQNRLTHAGIFGTRDRPAHRGWHDRNHGQYQDIRADAVTVSGAAYFVKREVWSGLAGCPVYREVAHDADGAFLPTQHYYEETWCSYHAVAHGYRVVYYGAVTIIHEWHKASAVGEAEKHMKESREYFRRACAAHRIPCD